MSGLLYDNGFGERGRGAEVRKVGGGGRSDRRSISHLSRENRDKLEGQFTSKQQLGIRIMGCTSKPPGSFPRFAAREYIILCIGDICVSACIDGALVWSDLWCGAFVHVSVSN